MRDGIWSQERGNAMLWSYMQLPDETQFAYSEMHEDGTVDIAIERPVDMGFDSAECTLPLCQWRNVEGFSGEELDFFERLLRDNAPLIFELAERRLVERAVA